MNESVARDDSQEDGALSNKGPCAPALGFLPCPPPQPCRSFGHPFLCLTSKSLRTPLPPPCGTSLAVSLQPQRALSITPSCLVGRHQPPHLAGPRRLPHLTSVDTRLPSAGRSPSGQGKGPGVLLLIPRKPLAQSLKAQSLLLDLRHHVR